MNIEHFRNECRRLNEFFKAGPCSGLVLNTAWKTLKEKPDEYISDRVDWLILFRTASPVWCVSDFTDERPSKTPREANANPGGDTGPSGDDRRTGGENPARDGGQVVSTTGSLQRFLEADGSENITDAIKKRQKGEA